MPRRWWHVLLVAASVVAVSVFAFVPSAVATSSADARATGDRLVARLRQSHACDVTTTRTFIAGGDSYLASCASKDGSFAFIAVVQAKSGGLTARSSYIERRVNDICKGAGGVVFTAGIRKQFFAMYLGTGKGVDVASGLWQGLAEQVGSGSGTFTTGERCADGNVTQTLQPTATSPTTTPPATSAP